MIEGAAPKGRRSVLAFIGAEDFAGLGVYEVDALTDKAGDGEIAVCFGRGDLVCMPTLDI